MDKVPKVSLVVDAETLCKVLGEAEDWDKKVQSHHIHTTRNSIQNDLEHKSGLR